MLTITDKTTASCGAKCFCLDLEIARKSGIKDKARRHVLQSIAHTVEVAKCEEWDDCLPSKKRCTKTTTVYEWLGLSVESSDGHKSGGWPRNKECEKNRAGKVQITGDVRVYDVFDDFSATDFMPQAIDVCGLGYAGLFKLDPPALWNQIPIARSIYAYEYEWDCCKDPPKGTKVNWTFTANNVPPGGGGNIIITLPKKAP
jgi:hypothetical protein